MLKHESVTPVGPDVVPVAVKEVPLEEASSESSTSVDDSSHQEHLIPNLR